jgi:lon-related putative ATP-dependent protease
MTRATGHAEDRPVALAPVALRNACDPALVGFDTTSDLKTGTTLLGQDRAIEAINLSAEIGHKDFNLFVLGPEGSGRHHAVMTLLGEAAKKRPVPRDWVYVNNFDAPHKPHAIEMPAGSAPRLKAAMQDLVDDLAHEIPAMFESEEYQAQARAINEEFGERHETPIAEFADQALKEEVALLRTPVGFMLAAIVNGKPITPEVYKTLAPEEREKIDAKVEALEERLSDILKLGPNLEKEHRQRMEKLHASMAEKAVSTRMAELRARFSEISQVADYLEEARNDMISNAELFLQHLQDGSDGPFPQAIRKYHSEPQFDRYAVNVMVSHANDLSVGASVVTEDLPSLGHLNGRIEYVSQMGTLVTNFTLIKPGALHRANQGYLVLDARQVLSEPYAWEALKRCLQTGTITITSMADRLGLSPTISLEPDPIPLDVRVVLIGDRKLHMLLQVLDPDFDDLFKVQADFEDDLPRTDDSTARYARIIAAHAARLGLLPLAADTVAAVLDHAVRLADDTSKFTLRISALADMMCEADQYARKAGQDSVTAADIARAIRQADLRAARIRDRIHEATMRDTILIDTTGSVVGQINGLSVLGIGNYSFGRPSRITATVRMGSGKFIDIEREGELGGPLHSKGVLILSGYLASRFAQDVPMALQASLVFEQSYGGVDGDSASSAELYALLSALSGLPLRQDLAVTGSVSQTGQVQAIGGVNEKIEGFFDLCKARGLSGSQGVLIPASNTQNLMLRDDVVQAATAGQFHVYPIMTIDQGITLLTGVAAGARGADGAFPEGTVNARVEARLRRFAEDRKRFAEKAGPRDPEAP